MNTILWILQSLIAVTFLIPGVLKVILSKEELVAKGLTGLQGLSLPLIVFIGIAEVLGAVGLMMVNICPELTIISAVGFALIMVGATIVNYKNQDYKKIVPTVIIFLICVFIAYGRLVFIR